MQIRTTGWSSPPPWSERSMTSTFPNPLVQLSVTSTLLMLLFELLDSLSQRGKFLLQLSIGSDGNRRGRGRRRRTALISASALKLWPCRRFSNLLHGGIASRWSSWFWVEVTCVRMDWSNLLLSLRFLGHIILHEMVLFHWQTIRISSRRRTSDDDSRFGSLRMLRNRGRTSNDDCWFRSSIMLRTRGRTTNDNCWFWSSMMWWVTSSYGKWSNSSFRRPPHDQIIGIWVTHFPNTENRTEILALKF